MRSIHQEGRVNQLCVVFSCAREAQPSARHYGGGDSRPRARRRPSYGVIIIAGGTIDPPEGGAVVCLLSDSGGTGALSLFLAIGAKTERVPTWCRRCTYAGSTAAPAESAIAGVTDSAQASFSLRA